jgi:Ca2+-transporting ATPase
MGFVVFSLFNIVFGLSARSEFNTVFDRDNISDRRQLQLYGLALLLTFLATELDFIQRILKTVSLSGNQWLVCIAAAVALVLIDEVVKFFMRRRQSQPAGEMKTAATAAGD